MQNKLIEVIFDPVLLAIFLLPSTIYLRRIFLPLGIEYGVSFGVNRSAIPESVILLSLSGFKDT